MSKNPVKVVLGMGSIGVPNISGDAAMNFINAFNSHGHIELDTAAAYPPNNPGVSESELAAAGPWAVISTKLPGGFQPGEQTHEKITSGLDVGLNKLQKKQVEILYLHFPDSTVPFESTLAGVDEAYKAGKFRRFGISNFSPAQIKEVLKICEEKGMLCLEDNDRRLLTSSGYVKPSVYQGQYNVFARKPEEELMPLLRSNGISFYAYS